MEGTVRKNHHSIYSCFDPILYKTDWVGSIQNKEVLPTTKIHILQKLLSSMQEEDWHAVLCWRPTYQILYRNQRSLLLNAACGFLCMRHANTKLLKHPLKNTNKYQLRLSEILQPQVRKSFSYYIIKLKHACSMTVHVLERKRNSFGQCLSQMSLRKPNQMLSHLLQVTNPRELL